MMNDPARNKDYARRVLKNQVDVAFGAALAFENAGMTEDAERQLASAVEAEAVLQRLEEIPVELCVPNEAWRVRKPATSGPPLPGPRPLKPAIFIDEY